MKPRWGRVVRLVALGVALSLVATCASHDKDTQARHEAMYAPPKVRYVYDPVGRLRAVTDPESDTAVYDYDPVGNIMSIDRYDSGKLSVIELSTRRAAAGKTLQIHGTGFADDPGDNKVSFGGVDAEVTESNGFVLSVKVPEGAESGPVTVSSGEDSAESPVEFDAEVVGPSISEVSAETAGVGEQITIKGEGFAEDPSLNQVRVGESYARVDESSPTELTVTLPRSAGSGKVSVATPDGEATTDDELLVAPAPLTSEVVGAIERAKLGDSADVEVDGGNAAVVVFEAEAGKPLSGVAELDSDQCTDLSIELVGPGGILLRKISTFADPNGLADLCISGEPVSLLYEAPLSGDYSLVFRPQQDDSAGSGEAVSLSGSVTVSDKAAHEPRPEPRADDPAKPDDIPPPQVMPDNPLAGNTEYPVDVVSGRLIFQPTDVFIDDTVPLWVSRGYDQAMASVFDAASVGPFGPGTASEFDMSILTQPRSATLTFSTGTTLFFNRVSEGLENEDAVYEHTDTPSAFNGARITPGDGYQQWNLTLRNGTTLVFGDPGTKLQAIRTPSGDQLTIHRGFDEDGDPAGPITAVSSPSGRFLEFAYNDDDELITAVTDHLGRKTTYGYSADQFGVDRLTSVTYPDGSTVSYGYQYRFMATISDRAGNPMVTVEYDDEGRVSRQTQADGSVWAFAYEVDGEGLVVETKVTDPAGVVRRIGVDEGRWVSDTVAAGTEFERTVEVERDPETRAITKLTDPLGRVSEYSYDDQRRLTDTTVLAGSDSSLTSKVEYGDFGLVSSMTDLAGQSMSYSHDDAGNLTSAVDPGDAETGYEADGQGRPVAVEDATGGRSEISYEGSHRVTFTGPAGGKSSEFYDAPGRLAVVTDPAGNQTRYGYDAADRVTSVTDPTGAVTRIAYDPRGNPTKITDANGNATGFGYDAMGRMVERTDPLGAKDTYRYDSFGNVVSHTDRRGVTTEFAYDPLGQLAKVSFGSESSITYSYDEAGRLTKVDDSAHGTTGFEYDDLDQLVKETTPEHTVAYSYDAAGQRTGMVVDDKTKTAYSYDDVGGLESVEQDDLSVSTERDVLGRVEDVELPNDTGGSYSYDHAGRIESINYGDQGALGYRYDASGRRTGLAGDLARTELPEPIEEATYDAANRITSWNGAHFTYDKAGNLTADGANTYSWDARGQLTGVKGDGTETSYAYDPFGRRTETTADGTTTTSAYDGPNVIQQQSDDKEPVSYLTGLGIDETFARTAGEGDSSVYLSDALGSTLGLVDDGGDLATSYSRDPYGTPVSDGEEDPNPFGFTGQQHDTSSGLTYMRARYYHPVTGRFISEDPLGHAAGDPNLYTYVGTSPTNDTDPTGTFAACLAISLDMITWVLGPGLDIATDPNATDEDFEKLWETLAAKQHEHLITCGTDAAIAIMVGFGPALGLAGGFGLRATLGTAGRSMWTRFTSTRVGGAVSRTFGVLESGPRPIGAIGPAGNPGGLRTVISGHGSYNPASGTFEVPPGTSITTYSPHGASITDALGGAVETGTQAGRMSYSRVFGPGSSIRDYTVHPPTGLNIQGNPVTVSQQTKLSELVRPHMGQCHLAFCLFEPGHPNSGVVMGLR